MYKNPSYGKIFGVVFQMFMNRENMPRIFFGESGYQKKSSHYREDENGWKLIIFKEIYPRLLCAVRSDPRSGTCVRGFRVRR